MNTDIRLSVGFFQHPKTRKTKKRLGLEAVEALLNLWLWVAVNRPDGDLIDMNWEDIELASDWQGEEKAFFDLCVGDGNASMWIDEIEDGHYVLHDWVEHNPWQAEAEERSNASRFGILAKVNKPIYEVLKKQGIKGLSKEEFERYKEASLSDIEVPLKGALSTLKENLSNAISPSPSPKPEENINNIHSAEKQKRAREQKPQQEEGFSFSASQEQENTPQHNFSYDEPSLEFQKLRKFYNEHGRSEAPLAGFTEYKQLKASKRFVGLARICNAVLQQSKSEPEKWAKFAPSLARFLREEWWNKEPSKGISTHSPPAKTKEQIAKEQREAEKALARIRANSRAENQQILAKKNQQRQTQGQVWSA